MKLPRITPAKLFCAILISCVGVTAGRVIWIFNAPRGVEAFLQGKTQSVGCDSIL